MKIQLTKNKVIEIGGAKPKSKADIVGVELFSQCARGCPAVRVRRRKSEWALEAADYVAGPDGALPERWDDVSKQPSWELPRAFQSASAALAVNTLQGSFGQASPEAIVQEMVHGVSASAAPLPSASAAAPGRRRFGIKHASPSEAAAPQPEARESAASAGGRRPALPPDGGEPVSENGRRFAVGPFAEEGFKLCASMPEFQALWVGRLLPEGRRPTAVSIQLAESALMASVLAQPEFLASGGNALVVFVRDAAIYFAGYKDGESVLWRRCPGVLGYRAMRAAVRKTLGIDEELVDSVLEESLIDPRPALEPFMHPVMEQFELARAYLSNKHGMAIGKALLMGLPRGVGHWRRYAEETLKIQLAAPGAFDGLEAGKGVADVAGEDFLVALGAALAATEAEAGA